MVEHRSPKPRAREFEPLLTCRKEVVIAASFLFPMYVYFCDVKRNIGMNYDKVGDF